MTVMDGMETGAARTMEKALWWKKPERCGLVGEESKNMPGRCLYVLMKDISGVHLADGYNKQPLEEAAHGLTWMNEET